MSTKRRCIPVETEVDGETVKARVQVQGDVTEDEQAMLQEIIRAAVRHFNAERRGYLPLSWLTDDDQDDLDTAIRTTEEAEYRRAEAEHGPDSCERCGGLGCTECRPDLGRGARR